MDSFREDLGCRQHRTAGRATGIRKRNRVCGDYFTDLRAAKALGSLACKDGMRTRDGDIRRRTVCEKRVNNFVDRTSRRNDVIVDNTALATDIPSKAGNLRFAEYRRR
jgi:hypothetical protein